LLVGRTEAVGHWHDEVTDFLGEQAGEALSVRGEADPDGSSVCVAAEGSMYVRLAPWLTATAATTGYRRRTMTTV
jgi:hypothetical protein